jgi:four helix bundle protein
MAIDKSGVSNSGERRRQNVIKSDPDVRQPINSYRDLMVWKKGIDLVTECYKLTGAFPKSQQYSLSDQLQRAAVSVPSNIAEGWGRQSTKEFLRHLSIAYGSLAEVETQLVIARKLEYISEATAAHVHELSTEVAKMIVSLKRSLRRRAGREKH